MTRTRIRQQIQYKTLNSREVRLFAYVKPLEFFVLGSAEIITY